MSRVARPQTSTWATCSAFCFWCWVAFSLGDRVRPGLYLDAIVPFGDGGSMDTAAFMFRFFAIQILFYGLGSGVLGRSQRTPRLLLVDVCPGPQQCDRHCELYGFCARVRTVWERRHHLDCGRYDPRCLCSRWHVRSPRLASTACIPISISTLRTPHCGRRLRSVSRRCSPRCACLSRLLSPTLPRWWSSPRLVLPSSPMRACGTRCPTR